MNCVKIPLSINGQRMSLPFGTEIVEGSKNFIVFEVECSDEWQGLMTFLQFQQEGLAHPINSYLDENNYVKLPPELKSGWCTIVPAGGNGEVTSSGTSLTLYIKRYLLKDGTTVTAVTPDLYHQLIAKIDKFIEEGIPPERLEELINKYIDENGIDVADGSVSEKKLDSKLLMRLNSFELSQEIINDTESSMVSLLLNSKQEYRFTRTLGVESLKVSIPDAVLDNFECLLVFISGSTATIFSYPEYVKWTGDDVLMGEFTPTANKVYNIAIWFDGVNVNGNVRGVFCE